MKGFLVVFITALVLTWMSARAQAATAIRVGKQCIFPVLRLVKLFYSAGIALGIGLEYLAFRGPQHDRVIVSVGGILIIASGVITWPKSVHAGESELRQRSWRGVWKTLPYSTIAKIDEKRDGSVAVRGKELSIVLSPYHAGRELFLRELRMRVPDAFA